MLIYSEVWHMACVFIRSLRSKRTTFEFWMLNENQYISGLLVVSSGIRSTSQFETYRIGVVFWEQHSMEAGRAH